MQRQEQWDFKGLMVITLRKDGAARNIDGTRTGILLVHDLANNKSYQNLYRWVAEIQDAIEKGAPSLSSSAINIRTDHEYTPKTILLPPTMQIGNKSDLYMASLPPVIEKIKTFETVSWIIKAFSPDVLILICSVPYLMGRYHACNKLCANSTKRCWQLNCLQELPKSQRW